MTDLKTKPQMDSPNSRAVIVMGMHRSGTSMLTRAINSIGISIGQKDALMVTLPDQNAAGFWEIQQLTDLNDEVLKRKGGIWHAPPFIASNSIQSEDFEDLTGQASQSLARIYQTRQWVWKDPRNCVTFPFWKPILPEKLALIYIYRNPLNVWKSLEKRDGFSKNKAFNLWEFYNFSAIQNMAGAPVLTVNYDQFLESPIKTVSQIQTFLEAVGFTGLVEPGDEEARNLAAVNLRHWYQTDKGFLQDNLASPSQIELYKFLLESQGIVSEFQVPVIQGWPDSAHNAGLQLHNAYTSQLMSEVSALYEKVDQLDSALNDQMSTSNTTINLSNQSISNSIGINEQAKFSKSIAKTAFFTIVSKNYLPYARVLCNSILQFHPDANVYVLLVDRLNGEFDPKKEPYQLVMLEELENIPNREHLFFKYNVLELNTAVKPYFFDYLMETLGYQKIVYFDPDIVVFQPLSELLSHLDTHSMVLTPHITQPYHDDRKPSEIDINLSGIYNLGFIAISDTPSMREFIAWWGQRLYYFCASDISRGLFTDQRWVNFAPTMFEGVHILRDPAYNIAYWNLHYRGDGIEFENGQLFLKNNPVIFFHFSGFDPDDIEMVSKHQNRFTLSDLPNIRPLFEFYRKSLIAAGHKEARTWKYALNHFDNGVRIPDIVRTIYRNMGGAALYYGNPFKTSGFTNFFDWLNKNLNVSDKPTTYPLSNIFAQIYALSPPLQRAFPDPVKKDNFNFLAWLKKNGAKHYQLDPVLLSATRPQNPTRQKNIKQRSSEKTLPFGVNIAGYLTGEFGTGQNARVNTKAIQSAGIPYVLNNITYTAHRTKDDSFTNFSKDNPYAINLIHVNADTTPVFRQIAGQDYFNDRYNIGIWWWELDQFPKEWDSYFNSFQEIWTQSSFCQKSIGRRSPIPVTMIPNVVHIEEEMIEEDRARFDIPEDVFSFIFSYDFYSVIKRKNPFAVIDAFKRAFGTQTDVMLILKSINDHVAPDQMRLMREYAAGINIRFIDKHLSRRDMVSLLTTADCYVSLHRSEGFGQGMAEAMFVGTPVIGTGYSGNMDFMTPENSYLVDFDMVELEESYGPYKKGTRWADPNVDHAATLMQEIFTKPTEASRKAEQAMADIRLNHSFEALGQKMVDRLEKIHRKQNSISISPRPASLSNPQDRDHLVDIVIPVYGKPALVQQCVKSVLGTTIKAHLYLVDDCSPGDEIQELFGGWEGDPRITLSQTPENQGFIGTTRLGASLGKAPFILFLNSDTEAFETDWLTKLIPDDEKVGIVGARLLYPDEAPGPLAGAIQHAGVGRNAKGIPYHPFLGWSANAPEANTTRELNAITGACFMVRRELWNQLEGWDPRFGRGVYEDVDFCWQVRKSGHLVIYEPGAALYHHESASRGPDGRHLLNEHTLENLELLLEKWGALESDEKLFFGEEKYLRWEKARKNLTRGYQLLNKQNRQGAFRLFNQAVKIAPDLADAHLVIGQTFAEEGNYKEAIAHLQMAIPLVPANWDARLLLTDALIKRGEFDEARTELDHLIAVFPHHPELLDRKNVLAQKINGPYTAANHSVVTNHTVITLETLLSADDVSTALVQHEDQLDEALLQLVRVNASTARSDGDIDLAEGLEALATYVADVLTDRQNPVSSNGDSTNGLPAQEFVHATAARTSTPATSSINDNPSSRGSKKRRRRRKKP